MKKVFLILICLFLPGCILFKSIDDKKTYLIHQSHDKGKTALACEYTGEDYCSVGQVLYYLNAPEDKNILFYDHGIFEIPDGYEEKIRGVYEWEDLKEKALHTSPEVWFEKIEKKENEEKNE